MRGEGDDLDDAALAGAGDTGDEHVLRPEDGVEELEACDAAGDAAADGDVAAGGGLQHLRAGEGDPVFQGFFSMMRILPRRGLEAWGW